MLVALQLIGFNALTVIQSRDFLAQGLADVGGVHVSMP